MPASSNVLPTQPQQQHHLLEPMTIGAKVIYVGTNISNLSQYGLDLRCSFGGGCMVASAQCQVTDALHTVLHCTLQQHPRPCTTNLPACTTAHSYLHYEDYICNAHAICAGICLFIYACSHTCMTVYSADAVQTARSSASGWNLTRSSCLCNCAPLHL